MRASTPPPPQPPQQAGIIIHQGRLRVDRCNLTQTYLSTPHPSPPSSSFLFRLSHCLTNLHAHRLHSRGYANITQLGGQLVSITNSTLGDTLSWCFQGFDDQQQQKVQYKKIHPRARWGRLHAN